ncbi:MAG: hypothetical protein AAF549_02910 [Pseudomonadota bacterium]
MSEYNQSGSDWPPKGWRELGIIKKLSEQAIFKDPYSAKVIGLSYKIEPAPVIKNNIRYNLYNIQIDGWEYTINNESREFPVLSFLLAEKEGEGIVCDSMISKIKTHSRSVINTKNSGQRALNAALYFIEEINNGSVPDFDQVLKLYKIHPSQRRLYRDTKTNSRKFFSALSFLSDKDKKHRKAV